MQVTTGSMKMKDGEAPTTRVRAAMDAGVVVVLGWLLLGPRLIVVPLGGSSVRLEDALFVLLAGFVLAHLLRSPGRRSLLPRQVVLSLGALLVVSLISAVVASASGATSWLPALLYAVRPLEYVLAALATVCALQTSGGRLVRWLGVMLVVVTILQTGFAVLQIVAHVPIGFSKVSYDRAAGLTGGPYELGAMEAALLVLWCANRRWVLAVVAALGLLLSASRISLIGALVGLAAVGLDVAVRTIRRRHRRQRLDRDQGLPGPPRLRRILTASGVVVVLAVALPLAYVAFAKPVVDRLDDTSVSGSWAFSGKIADHEPLVATTAQYDAISYGRVIQALGDRAAETPGVEASNGIRFYRWHLVLDNVNTLPEYLLGLGPSFIGPSLDGSYLRFFAETGLLGVAVWLWLLSAWFRARARYFVGVVLTLVITAVFIDIFWSMRPMTLFWLLFALAASRRSITEFPAPPLPGRAARPRARHRAAKETTA